MRAFLMEFGLSLWKAMKKRLGNLPKWKVIKMPKGDPLEWKTIKKQLDFSKQLPDLPAENLKDLLMVEEAKKAWQDSITYFEEVTEPALIDFAIYQMEASEKRMVHLIRLMEEKYPEGIWPPNFRKSLGIFDFKVAARNPEVEG